MTPSISLAVLAAQPSARIGGSRCQQQREPPVDGYCAVSVGRIVLGEGVETECEQEYRDELFHVDRFVFLAKALVMKELKGSYRKTLGINPYDVLAWRQFAPLQDPVFAVH